MWQEELEQEQLIEGTLRDLGLETTRQAEGSEEASLDVEVLGLLAYQLDPVAPSVGGKARLMAALGDTVGEVPTWEPAPRSAPVVGELVSGRGRFGARAEAAPGAPPVFRFGGVSGLLAATLALCLVGLGYLLGQSQEQRKTIARLDQQVAGHAEDIRSVASVLDELDTAERKLNMVTRVARVAYPMETVAPIDPGVPRPDGMIYVCGQHQRWYLNVDGLEPPPPGQEYRLWFLTDKGSVPGGVIEVEPGAVAEKEAQNMPPGTRGFSITLEDAGGVLDHPEGIAVLMAEDSVSL